MSKITPLMTSLHVGHKTEERLKCIDNMLFKKCEDTKDTILQAFWWYRKHSIPLEKVKKAKEKIENIGMGSYLEVTKEIECNDREVRLSKKFATAILDKLIESEKFYCADFEKRGDLDGSN